MEPSGYGTDNAVRYWPPVPEDSYLLPELDSSAAETAAYPFDVAEDVGSVVDSDGEVAVPRDVDTWYQIGEFQLAQAGKMQPIRRSEDTNHHKCSVFKRRMILRRADACGGDSELHFVNIFHFKGGWKLANEVPASRAHFLHLLEEVIANRGLGPALVHCLDGATRSGLFVANLILAERITRDHFVDLFHCLKALKLRRRAVIISAVSCTPPVPRSPQSYDIVFFIILC